MMIIKPRVVIADPQPLMAEALEKLLEAEFTVAGHASDGRVLLDMVACHHPDVAVVDVGLPLLNGLEAGSQAKRIDHQLKIVIMTGTEDPDLAAQAIRTCASAFVLKRCAGSELIRAIREVLQQRTYVTPLITEGMVHSLLRASLGDQGAPDLTARQRQVLQLLAEGKSMKQAGSVLGITARTVAFHKYRMMQQLHVTTSAELMRVAFKRQLA
jgi:DNA-binding NarL/FixJ family response regulator